MLSSPVMYRHTHSIMKKSILATTKQLCPKSSAHYQPTRNTIPASNTMEESHLYTQPSQSQSKTTGSQQQVRLKYHKQCYNNLMLFLLK